LSAAAKLQHSRVRIEHYTTGMLVADFNKKAGVSESKGPKRRLKEQGACEKTRKQGSWMGIREHRNRGYNRREVGGVEEKRR
jgi:hypothetical protein